MPADDVPHLVAELTAQLRAVRAFHVADPLRVDSHQFWPGEIERNADCNRAEVHAPFVGEVEVRSEAADAGPVPIALVARTVKV